MVFIRNTHSFKLLLILLFVLLFPLHLYSAEAKNEPSEKIVLAEGLIDDGLYSLAVSELESYLEQGVRKDEVCSANLLLGKAYLLEQRNEEAIDSLQLPLKTSCSLKEHEQAYYYLGRSYFEAGKMEQAKKVMEKLLYLYPESEFITHSKDIMAQSLYQESLNLFNSEDYSSALKGFKKLLSLDATKVPKDMLQLQIGDSLFHLGEYDKAEATYREVLSQYNHIDDKPRIRFQLAAIKYKTGGFDEAIALMRAFLKDFPEHSLSKSASSIILWSLYKKGQYEEALNYLNLFEGNSGNVADDHLKDIVNSARELLKLGRNIDAVKYLEEKLSELGEDPLNGDMMLLLAKAYRGTGRQALEEETYREVIRRYPLSSVAARSSRYLLGEITFKKGYFRESSTHFSSFLEEDKLGELSDDALYYLAESFMNMGEIEKAGSAFKSIVESYKDSGFYSMALVKTADIDFMTGAYSRAAARYEDILAMPKGDLDALNLEELLWKNAEALRWGGDNEAAVKGYEKFIARYPEGGRLLEARVRLGDLKYLLGDYRGGIKVFEQILNDAVKDKALPEYYMKLASGYLSLQDLPDYLKVLSRIIKEHPESEEAAVAYYLKGMAADEREKYELANKDYLLILKKFPKTPLKEEVEWQIGMNYFRVENYDKALKSFRNFSLSYPESGRNSEEWIMKCYAAMGDFKKAIETSSAFFEVSPDSSIDLKKRYDEALALFEVASYRDAIKLAGSIIASHPSNNLSSRLLVMIGESYLRLKKQDQAAKYFSMSREMMSAGPLTNLAFFRTAEIFFRNNDFRGAILELEKIDQSVFHNDKESEIRRYVDPDYVSARMHFLKGEAYLNLKLYDKAIENYQVFIEGYPDLTGMNDERLRAGIVCQKNKKYDLAIKAMRQIVALSVDTTSKAEAQYWIGENYQYKGDVKNAIIEYLKVSYLYPKEYMWGLTARYMAAQAYEETGRYEDAIKLYNLVAKKSNDKGKREFARHRAKELMRKVSENLSNPDN